MKNLKQLLATQTDEVKSNTKILNIVDNQFKVKQRLDVHQQNSPKFQGNTTGKKYGNISIESVISAGILSQDEAFVKIDTSKIGNNSINEKLP